MEDMNTKSLRFSISEDSKLKSMALKYGRTKRTLFIQMIDYFYRSKKDPIDINDELLKNTLLKSHKDYIGFIKTQETELLIPIKREVGKMIATQIKLVNYFNDHVIIHNQTLLKNQQIQTNKFQQTDELMKVLINKLDTKDKLKKEFIIILEYYIKTRESFSMMTSSREKEELIERIKTQVNNL